MLLLPVPHASGVVVPVSISSMSQIDLFKIIHIQQDRGAKKKKEKKKERLKRFYCMQIELLVLDSNT